MLSTLVSATIAASLMAAVPAAAPQSAPQWEADYGKALQATRADDQPLLIVLEQPATTENSVQQVAHTAEAISAEESQLLASYQLCKVDVSTEYGKKVAQSFGATSFPHTAIIDRTGSVIIYSKTGSHDNAAWSNMLTTYKSGERTDAVLASTSSSATTTVVFRRPYEETTTKPYCSSCQRN